LQETSIMSDHGRSRSPERDGGRDAGRDAGDGGPPPSRNDDHEGKLFLGNLSYDIREEDLKDEFGKFGPIAEIKLPMDRDYNRPKGFGFITFENPNDAKVAKEELHEKDILGRAIRVDLSTPKDQLPPPRRRDDRGGGGGGFGGPPRGPRSNVCYSWRRGECDRGRDCRFDHFESDGDDRRGGGYSDDRRGGGGYRDDRRDRYDDRRGGGDRYDDRRGGGGGRDRGRDRDYDRRDRSRSRDRGGRGDRY